MSNPVSFPAPNSSSPMMDDLVHLLKVERKIRIALATGQLDEAKSLFTQENWSSLLSVPGKLWLAALDAPLSKETQAWLTSLIPLDKSLQYWSLDKDTFTQLSQNNPELFEKLAYMPNFSYSDYLYSALLRAPCNQALHPEALWVHLRNETQRWRGAGDKTAFACALSSDNLSAIQWLLKVGQDWNGFSEALKGVMTTSPEKVVVALKSLPPLDIQWEPIAMHLGTEFSQNIRASLEQESFSASIPEQLLSKASSKLRI